MSTYAIKADAFYLPTRVARGWLSTSWSRMAFSASM